MNLRDQGTWLRRDKLARLIAKILVADYGEFVTIYTHGLVTIGPKVYFQRGSFSKRSEQTQLHVIFFFFNNFHSVTLNLVYFKNPAFLVSNLMEPLVFIVKDLGLVCFLGGGGNEEVA